MGINSLVERDGTVPRIGKPAFAHPADQIQQALPHNVAEEFVPVQVSFKGLVGKRRNIDNAAKGGIFLQNILSVNLAVALAQSGASVGLLDGDITGPNIPMMLGLEGQPKASANNKITPLERYGVKTISIQFFVPEGQPYTWM